MKRLAKVGRSGVRKRHKQEDPEEREADHEARKRARQQHEIVEHCIRHAAVAVAGQPDQQIDADRQGAADRRQQDGVDDAAHQARHFGEAVEVRQGQLVEKIDALAPGVDEGAQDDAGDRQDDGDEQP